MKNTARLISAVAFTAIAAENVWADLNDGLVAYYPFNGNAQDASVHGNHGIVNGATLTKDRFGNADSAYRFDGKNDYVQVAKNDRLNFGSSVDFTMGSWIKAKPSQLAAFLSIIGRRNLGATNNGYVFFLWADGRLGAHLNYGSSNKNYKSTSPDLRDDKWHHVAVTGDRNGYLTFYVDGAHKGRVGISGIRNIDSLSDLFIGWEPVLAASTYFNGVIDDIRIYNRTLSKAEIKQLYKEENLSKAEIEQPHKEEGDVHKSLCKLNVTVNIPEKQLEQDDDATYQFTVKQVSECCRAENVVAKLALTGKYKGITLKPSSLNFGNLGPTQSARKDAKVTTQNATVGKDAFLSMDFDYQCVSVAPGKAHKDVVIEVLED